MDYYNKNVSINLRRIRKSKQMSLDSMAVETGISKSMLGQIERGVANPTITVLGKIVSGLRISFDDLIGLPIEQSYVIRRENLTPIKQTEGSFQNYAYFQYEEDRDFEVYSVDIEPGGFYPCGSHGEKTIEYLIVFSGELTLELGDETHVLGQGDAIRFKSDNDHIYRNNGKDMVRICMVFSWK
jgi:XRE family transcriptional regulator, regulator of sulfur utilization